MTQHSSLRTSSKSKQHRSVLKRFERLKYLKEKDKWEEGMSILGLPKIKIIKFKIKKEKAAPEEALATAGQEGAVPKEAVEGAQVKEGAAARGAGAAPGAKKEERAQPKGPAPKREEKPKK